MMKPVGAPFAPSSDKIRIVGMPSFGGSALCRSTALQVQRSSTSACRIASAVCVHATRSYYDKFRADHELKQDPHGDFFQDMPRINDVKEPIPEELKRVDIDVQARGDTMHRWFVVYSFFLFGGVCYLIWEPLSDGQQHKAKYNRRGAPAAWEVAPPQSPCRDGEAGAEKAQHGS